jgi:hypothetical protein
MMLSNEEGEDLGLGKMVFLSISWRKNPNFLLGWEGGKKGRGFLLDRKQNDECTQRPLDVAAVSFHRNQL